MRRRGICGEAGSSLLAVLMTTATLSVIVGTSLLHITNRSQTAGRSAAWQQACVLSEAGADLAVAEIRRVMPTLGARPADAWSGWSASVGSSVSALPGGRALGNTVLKLLPPALQSGGELNVDGSAAVVIDAPVALTDEAGRQWLRVRATGTAAVGGRRFAAQSKLDAELRRLAFVTDWRTGTQVTRPQVSRSIEVIVRPVPLFNSALVTQGAISARHPNALVDSFDSGNVAKSTSGEYDSRKRQKNGDIYTLGTAFEFVGEIAGDAGTNGGTLTRTANIDGTVTNDYYQALPSVAAPSGFLPLTMPDVGNVNLTASTGGLVTRYKMASLSNRLKVSGDPGSRAEIWVTGNLTGDIRVDPGVRLTVYVGGDIRLSTDDIDNRTRRAANLQILGIKPPPGQTRTIELDLDEDLIASIYAPEHSLILNGHGHLMGAFVTKSLSATGKAQFHFDEVLAREAGPIADYKAASWVEEVR